MKLLLVTVTLTAMAVFTADGRDVRKKPGEPDDTTDETQFFPGETETQDGTQLSLKGFKPDQNIEDKQWGKSHTNNPGEPADATDETQLFPGETTTQGGAQLSLNGFKHDQDLEDKQWGKSHTNNPGDLDDTTDETQLLPGETESQDGAQLSLNGFQHDQHSEEQMGQHERKPKKPKCKRNVVCGIVGGICVTNKTLCSGRLVPEGCKGKDCECCAPGIIEDKLDKLISELQSLKVNAKNVNLTLYTKLNSMNSNINSNLASKLNSMNSNINSNLASKISTMNTNINSNLASKLNSVNSNINSNLASKLNSMNSNINSNLASKFNSMNYNMNSNLASKLNSMNSNISTNLSSKLNSMNSNIKSQLASNLYSMNSNINSNLASRLNSVNSNINSNIASRLSSMNSQLISLLKNQGCLGGFQMSTQCFKFYKDQARKWSDAKAFCLSRGYILAEPDDSIAVPLRRYLYNVYGSGNDVWVGAIGNGHGYMWQSKRTYLSNTSPLWEPGNPQSKNGSYCLEMNLHHGSLRDRPVQPYDDDICTRTQYALCEVLIK